MADPEKTARGRIKIGVEHTALVAELELDARPLADLQSGIAKPRHQLLRI